MKLRDKAMASCRDFFAPLRDKFLKRLNKEHRRFRYNTSLFFYKNIFYKNIEAEICEI